MFLEGSLSSTLLLGYMAAQSIGAFMAAFLFHFLTETTFFPMPAQQVLAWEAIFVEMILTFVFCAICIIIARKKIATNELSIGGLVIGLSLAALIFTGGDISGGIFNPAVGLGTILFDVIKGGESLNSLPIYLVGPFLGAVAASIFYTYVAVKE